MLFVLIMLPVFSAVTGYFFKKDRIFYSLSLSACAAEFLCACLTAFLPPRAETAAGLAGFGLFLETDGFRKIYIVIIAFMWLLTMLFSRDYFEGHGNLPRYLFFNLMTLGATMGVFLSADFMTALIFFEIMSFTSFPWVIQEETDNAVRAAETYLAIAVIGGLLILMGLFLLQNALGTLRFADLYEAAQSCPDRKTLTIAGSCILFGFGAKAGMFPLHVWLPKAHPAAPAPASALLSGVLTKSGIFGIIAISVSVFRYDPAFGRLILILGTVTMFLGALLALFSIDLKRTLACSSMSQIGFILIGIGMSLLLGTENALAARGALLHMINHSLFKLVLFMIAGAVYMNVHALDLNEVRGFGRGKPFLNVCFLTAAAGIAGIPGLNGYVSKTLLHEAIIEGEPLYGTFLHVVEWIFLISGGLTLAYMTKLYVCLFIEKKTDAAFHTAFGAKYMRPASFAAIGIAALSLPVLGFSANGLMNRLADFGTDFLHAGTPAVPVVYYSAENLQGALISIVIGAFLYFAVVRKLLMKNGRYINVLPEKADLETLIYRPALTRFLPNILGAVTALFGENRILAPLACTLRKAAEVLMHAFSDLPDANVLVLSKTVFKESRPASDLKAAGHFSYRFGAFLDRMERKKKAPLFFSYRLFRSSKLKKDVGNRYARLFYRVRQTIIKTTHELTDTLSFALFMLCLAICAIMIYIFVIRK